MKNIMQLKNSVINSITGWYIESEVEVKESIKCVLYFGIGYSSILSFVFYNMNNKECYQNSLFCTVVFAVIYLTLVATDFFQVEEVAVTYDENRKTKAQEQFDYNEKLREVTRAQDEKYREISEKLDEALKRLREC